MMQPLPFNDAQGNQSMRWLLKKLRAELQPGSSGSDGGSEGLLGGGYEWSCGDTYPPGAVRHRPVAPPSPAVDT